MESGTRLGPYEIEEQLGRSSTSIALDWTYYPIDESGFKVLQRQRAAGGWSRWKPLGKLRRGTHRTIVRGLEPDTLYELRVRAYNRAGSSDPATARATTS